MKELLYANPAFIPLFFLFSKEGKQLAPFFHHFRAKNWRVNWAIFFNLSEKCSTRPFFKNRNSFVYHRLSIIKEGGEGVVFAGGIPLICGNGLGERGSFVGEIWKDSNVPEHFFLRHQVIYVGMGMGMGMRYLFSQVRRWSCLDSSNSVVLSTGGLW